MKELLARFEAFFAKAGKLRSGLKGGRLPVNGISP